MWKMSKLTFFVTAGLWRWIHCIFLSLILIFDFRSIESCRDLTPISGQNKNISIGTMDPTVQCFHQRNCFLVIAQVHQTSASNVNQTGLKIQVQNLDQKSAPMPKSSLKILTKLQLQNLKQT